MANEENGRWITVNGNRIFIKDGQTVEEAMVERFGGKKGTIHKGTPSEVKNVNISDEHKTIQTPTGEKKQTKVTYDSPYGKQEEFIDDDKISEEFDDDYEEEFESDDKVEFGGKAEGSGLEKKSVTLNENQAKQLKKALRSIDKYNLYKIAYGSYPYSIGPIGQPKEELIEDATQKILDLGSIDEINEQLDFFDSKYKIEKSDLDDEYSSPDFGKKYDTAGEYTPASKEPESQRYNSWYTLDQFKNNLKSVASKLSKDMVNMSPEDVKEARDDIEHLLKKTLKSYEADAKNDSLDFEKTRDYYGDFLRDARNIQDKMQNKPAISNAIKDVVDKYEKQYNEITQSKVNSGQNKHNNFNKLASSFINSDGSDDELDKMINEMRKDYSDEEIIKKLATMFKGTIK